MITSSGPGDLFTVHNTGNLVPPSGMEEDSSVAASLEYAVNHLARLLLLDPDRARFLPVPDDYLPSSYLSVDLAARDVGREPLGAGPGGGALIAS